MCVTVKERQNIPRPKLSCLVFCTNKYLIYTYEGIPAMEYFRCQFASNRSSLAIILSFTIGDF